MIDTILVTGGAGFFGSWIVRYWFATGLDETMRGYLDNPAWAAAATAKFDRSHRLGMGALC